MTPTAEDLKAELLAHACKLPASGPPVRAGRPDRAASAGAELPAYFGAAPPGPQQGPQSVLAFPACSSCPPEFWGDPLGCPPCAVLPSTQHASPSQQGTMHMSQAVWAAFATFLHGTEGKLCLIALWTSSDGTVIGL